MGTFESKNYKLTIKQDEFPENPRTFYDHMAVMVCFHRNYKLGDKHDYKQSDYNNWDELEKAIKSENEIAVIEPLYLFDHSGITISTTPFSCRWDSGRVGLIYITKEVMREMFNIKKVTKKWLQKASEIIKGEVKEYDDYITGNVWSFFLENLNDNSTDSCSGFIGDVKENDIFEYIENECLVELYPQIKKEYGMIEYIEKLVCP